MATQKSTDDKSKQDGAAQGELQSQNASVTTDTLVTLLGPYKNYSKGDITRFSAEVAERLIQSKLAVPYQAQLSGNEAASDKDQE